jgi:hypothetical protein
MICKVENEHGLEFLRLEFFSGKPTAEFPKNYTQMNYKAIGKNTDYGQTMAESLFFEAQIQIPIPNKYWI